MAIPKRKIATTTYTELPFLPASYYHGNNNPTQFMKSYEDNYNAELSRFRKQKEEEYTQAELDRFSDELMASQEVQSHLEKLKEQNKFWSWKNAGKMVLTGGLSAVGSLIGMPMIGLGVAAGTHSLMEYASGASGGEALMSGALSFGAGKVGGALGGWIGKGIGNIRGLSGAALKTAISAGSGIGMATAAAIAPAAVKSIKYKIEAQRGKKQIEELKKKRSELEGKLAEIKSENAKLRAVDLPEISQILPPAPAEAVREFVPQFLGGQRDIRSIGANINIDELAHPITSVVRNPKGLEAGMETLDVGVTAPSQRPGIVDQNVGAISPPETKEQKERGAESPHGVKPSRSFGQREQRMPPEEIIRVMKKRYSPKGSY